MKFGPIRLREALGAIVAHTIGLGQDGVIRKGTRIGIDEVARLDAAGIDEIIGARLEMGDVHEDAAAERIADAVLGAGIVSEPGHTGRCNLFARSAGLLQVDKAGVDRLNRIDPAITFATLPEAAAVEAGRMVATVKIIPFAVNEVVLTAAITAAQNHGRGLIEIAPYRPLRIGLAATRLPGTKPSVLDKTRRVLQARLDPAGAEIAEERRVGHDVEALAGALRGLAGAGHDLIVIFGASAVVDPGDVLPAAIVAAGGRVDHLGMPVDPGNLLIIGELAGVPVIGAPGCARSPKENGFDWVLQRMLAGLDVTAEDIMAMGVGGLLMEIVTRPQPREAAAESGANVAAIVLAAGRSRRMGGPNKLIATIDGVPIVRRAVEAALESRATSVTVVTGHRADAVEAALDGLDVAFVHNTDYAEGLSTSLRAGIGALPEDVDAALVLLGDMPMVAPEALDRLIDAFDPEAGAMLVVPTYRGKRGNPILWSRRFFDELTTIHGDTGARHLIGEYADGVVEVEIGEAVAIDVDTQEALKRVGGEVAAGDD